jgi:sensor domain CHASE-containing protein
VRRPRLFWRIYATYLVVIVLSTAAVGFYAVRSARSFYVQHTESELQARAQLVREQVATQIGTQTSSSSCSAVWASPRTRVSP